ncbi:hypothetical protein G9Z98_003846 [Salmonella enterica]|nr:hypothetical protein [Salmonella enterica]EEH2895462.1 hypothetical protein [Salmonella enterica]EEK3037532.1 hypothetical protein [Salmonella enterica]EJO4891959.1 hypothetical protein [Salmonella enterica]ELX5461550.1 hypothetical protein [Salmonella enterica]
MNTHNAINALKESGFDEKQAEKIVEVIAVMQNINVATKEDLNVSTDSLKTDPATIKTNQGWIKKFILFAGISAVISRAEIYFFSLNIKGLSLF